MPHSLWMMFHSLDDVLDVPFIVPFMHQDGLGVSGIDKETGVTTVVILSWVYHCGYDCIGVCGCMWVVVLGVLL